MSGLVIKAEPSKSYGASYAVSATRLDMPLRDVPQTITVITDKLIRDTGAVDILEAATYTSGYAPRGPDGYAVVRGLLVNAIYKNLVLEPVPVHPDLTGVASVEIIKGPASAIAGRGNAAGLLNYTMKKPVVGQRFGDWRLTLGTDDLVRSEVDYNAPVSGLEDHLTYRVAGAVMRGHHFGDPGKIERFALYPSFTWRFSEKTELTLELDLTDKREPANTGLTYNSFTRQWAPFSFSISEEYARDKSLNYGATATFVHAFNDHISFRQIVHGSQYDRDFNWVWADALKQADATSTQLKPGEYYIERSFFDQDADAWGAVLQGDLLARYSFANGFVNNRTLLSYDSTWSAGTDSQTNYKMLPIGLTSNVHGTRPFDPVFINRRRQENSTFGYLISHQSSFWKDRITGTFGWRKDRNGGTRFTDLPTGVTSKNPSSSVAHKRYGVILKPVKEISAYWLFSDNNEPANRVLHFPGLPIDHPRNSWIDVNVGGKMTEFGLKSELLGGRLSLSIARFKLQQFGSVSATQFGPAQDDPATAGLLENIVLPADTVEGWEVESSGSLGNGTSFIATYYDTDASRYINGAFRGFRGVPDRTATLWLNHVVWKKQRESLEVRGGVRWQSSQWADINNTFRFDAAHKFDLGAVYHAGKWSVQLNVNNVTNELVPIQPNAFRYNTVLPPREYRLTFIQSF